MVVRSLLVTKYIVHKYHVGMVDQIKLFVKIIP
jgi:hypothetical protein